MSPRAAWRLEALGFDPVYDYVAGKADWLAAGRSTERSAPRPARAIDVVDRDVLVCGPDNDLAVVAARAREAGLRSCVVITAGRVVAGRLHLDRLDVSSSRSIEDTMDPGPATVRADADVAETVQRLVAKGILDILVTTPEGELIGVLRAMNVLTPRSATR